MAILNIVLYPAPVLHRAATAVAQVDDTIRQLLDDMTETMYAAPGVGLAAPQVNVSQRLIVIDIAEGRAGVGATRTSLYQMVNPEIIAQSGEIEWEEGCLSIPDFLIVMKRSRQVRCRYLDSRSREQVIEAEGLLAVCLQHEIDHLNGKLIIDTVSRLKQDLYLQKLKKGKTGRSTTSL